MKIKLNTLFLAFALCIFSLSVTSCNNDGSTTDDHTSDSLNQTNNGDNMSKIDGNDADYLVDAAKGGLKEVEAGRIAVSKAKNADVKSFAQMMIDDHTAMNQQVKTIANNKNVSLPDALPQNELDDLKNNDKTGLEFDKDYMDKMVDDHEKTLKLFKDAADNAKDPEIKKLFAEGAPKIEAHLQKAKQIKDSLK